MWASISACCGGRVCKCGCGPAEDEAASGAVDVVGDVCVSVAVDQQKTKQPVDQWMLWGTCVLG